MLVLGVVLAGLAGAAAVARGVDPVPVAGLVGAFLALLGAGVFVFRHAPVPTPTRPGALEFDPITGMWGASGFPLGSLHAPQAAAEAALGEGPAPRAAPAPRPAGPCPEACPHCGEPLAADDDEDEPLLTCYHCGGDLVDLGGRYLPARQREG